MCRFDSEFVRPIAMLRFDDDDLSRHERRKYLQASRDVEFLLPDKNDD